MDPNSLAVAPINAGVPTVVKPWLCGRSGFYSVNILVGISTRTSECTSSLQYVQRHGASYDLSCGTNLQDDLAEKVKMHFREWMVDCLASHTKYFICNIYGQQCYEVDSNLRRG